MSVVRRRFENAKKKRFVEAEVKGGRATYRFGDLGAAPEKEVFYDLRSNAEATSHVNATLWEYGFSGYREAPVGEWLAAKVARSIHDVPAKTSATTTKDDEDRRMWATVFANAFPSEKAFERFFRNVRAASAVAPITFAFAKGWTWKVTFLPPRQGSGVSHEIVRRGKAEKVARLDAHSERWNELELGELRALAESIEKDDRLVPLLLPLCVSSKVTAKERRALEKWMARALEAANVTDRPNAMVEELGFFAAQPRAPKRTKTFLAFLEGVLGRTP